jgi:shikimate kinase
VSRHVVLIGLSGAGKSAVGRAAARLLHCAFRDLDDDIVRRSGMAVPELFRRHGEAEFRMREREAMERALVAPAHLVATGGGWAAEPGNLERTRGVALVVYLRCTPETAAARLGGSTDRPLLAGDALEALRAQFAVRAGFYQRADAAVDTDGRGIEEVAEAVAALARTNGGW